MSHRLHPTPHGAAQGGEVPLSSRYVSRDAPSSRADVSASYRVDAEDSEGSPEGSPD